MHAVSGSIVHRTESCYDVHNFSPYSRLFTHLESTIAVAERSLLLVYDNVIIFIAFP